MLTREEQRARASRRLMTSVGLHAHLRNLIREIKAGDASKLSEFQQFVQYAPAEMKSQLLNEM
jgi:hypothetical protein